MVTLVVEKDLNKSVCILKQIRIRLCKSEMHQYDVIRSSIKLFTTKNNITLKSFIRLHLAVLPAEEFLPMFLLLWPHIECRLQFSRFPVGGAGISDGSSSAFPLFLAASIILFPTGVYRPSSSYHLRMRNWKCCLYSCSSLHLQIFYTEIGLQNVEHTPAVKILYKLKKL